MKAREMSYFFSASGIAYARRSEDRRPHEKSGWKQGLFQEVNKWAIH